MATYRGLRRVDGTTRLTGGGKLRGGRPVVTVDGRALEPRRDLYNHSPDGFEWGYLGSGPAQLALAILAAELEDDDRALRLHQYYKERVIARLDPDEPWTLSSEQVRTVVADLEHELSVLEDLDADDVVDDLTDAALDAAFQDALEKPERDDGSET
jgi:Family of unknown function (DUF6166)